MIAYMRKRLQNKTQTRGAMRDRDLVSATLLGICFQKEENPL